MSRGNRQSKKKTRQAQIGQIKSLVMIVCFFSSVGCQGRLVVNFLTQIITIFICEHNRIFYKTLYENKKNQKSRHHHRLQTIMPRMCGFIIYNI